MVRFLLTILIALSTLATAQSVKFAVTDIEGMEFLQQEFGAFTAALE